MAHYEVTWFPQPKQARLLAAAGLFECLVGGQPTRPYCSVIGYGGAAFGGKTDGALGLGMLAAFAFPGCNIAYFRRTFPELNVVGGAIKRSEEIFTGVANYNKQSHTWTFPTGSHLQFCYAQNESDVLNFKSAQFDVLIIDEATSFTWYMLDYLQTRNRASCATILKPFTVMLTNPGDVGHSAYMQLFDTIGSRGPHETIKTVETPNGTMAETYFIPAFVTDNAIGLQRDPEYPDRLAKRDPQTAKALLKGDWTSFEGQAFPQWRMDRHTCDAFAVPNDWVKWRSLDYGWDHPTVVYWHAKDPEFDRIYTYRELMMRQRTDTQMASSIKEYTLPGERILSTFASPDMWKAQRAEDLVTTAPETFASLGVPLTKADNERVNGKRKINQALAPKPDGLPGIMVFRDECPALVAVMPTLVRDKQRPDDVLKVDGDDPYDAWRYGLTNYQPAGQQQQQGGRTSNPLEGLIYGRTSGQRHSR